MARRNLKDRNIRKLTKIGGKSIAVKLPIEFIRELKWKSKQKIVIKKHGSKLVIEDRETNMLY
jgi:antitoxin component of MazEF toxin-antitoxin module